MQNKNEYKPGEIAQENLTLNVVDEQGEKVSEINVPKGNTIPPTREENAEKYEKA